MNIIIEAIRNAIISAAPHRINDPITDPITSGIFAAISLNRTFSNKYTMDTQTSRQKAMQMLQTMTLQATPVLYDFLEANVTRFAAPAVDEIRKSLQVRNVQIHHLTVDEVARIAISSDGGMRVAEVILETVADTYADQITAKLNP